MSAGVAKHRRDGRRVYQAEAHNLFSTNRYNANAVPKMRVRYDTHCRYTSSGCSRNAKKCVSLPSLQSDSNLYTTRELCVRDFAIQTSCECAICGIANAA